MVTHDEKGVTRKRTRAALYGVALVSFAQYMWRAHRHNEAERMVHAS